MRLVTLFQWNNARLEQRPDNIFAPRKGPEEVPSAFRRVSSIADDEDNYRSSILSKVRRIGLATWRPAFERFDSEHEKDELGGNPEKWIGRTMGRIIASAMVAQALGCLALQLLLPRPIAIVPRVVRNIRMRSLFRTHMLSVHIIGVLFLIVFAPTFIFLVWRIREVNGIKLDILVTLIASLSSFTIWGLWTFSIKSDINVDTFELPIIYIASTVFLISHFTSVVLPIMRTFRTQWRIFLLHRNLQIDKDEESQKRRWLQVTESDFEETLSNPKLFEQFKIVCARNFTVVHPIFHEACWEADKLFHAYEKKQLSTLMAPTVSSPTRIIVRGISQKSSGESFHSEVEIVMLCHRIWESHVRLGSLMEIDGISNTTKLKVEQQIVEGCFDRTLFEEAMVENMEVMFRDMFPKFVREFNAGRI
ncbi:hypothetical protein HDU67_004722 [Dinochytrium kinnereticum]|nr:hypothetical protein HDU67_004722 [Dinochytrium kinnereticum]